MRGDLVVAVRRAEDDEDVVVPALAGAPRTADRFRGALPDEAVEVSGSRCADLLATAKPVNIRTVERWSASARAHRELSIMVDAAGMPIWRSDHPAVPHDRDRDAEIGYLRSPKTSPTAGIRDSCTQITMSDMRMRTLFNVVLLLVMAASACATQGASRETRINSRNLMSFRVPLPAKFPLLVAAPSLTLF